MRKITRRSLIACGAAVVVAGAALAAVENHVLPGRTQLHNLLGLNGPAGTLPADTPGLKSLGNFNSDARLGKLVNWTISYPPGTNIGDKLPVMISLHGVGGDSAYSFGDHLGLDRFQAAGRVGFAIASIDGGDTYWHKRTTGEDSGAMITDEFIPLLKQHGLDTSRIAMFGWSMGGYGALLLGERLKPRAIVAESPALWPRASEAAARAFDGAADYAANNVYGRQGQLADIPVRVDCGDGDGFEPNAIAYRAGFATPPAGGISPGAHTDEYWRRMAPAQLEFVQQHIM